MRRKQHEKNKSGNEKQERSRGIRGFAGTSAAYNAHFLTMLNDKIHILQYQRTLKVSQNFKKKKDIHDIKSQKKKKKKRRTRE
jgi:hypothetical protein